MKKTKLDSISDELAAGGWETRLSALSLENIIATGIRGKNIPLAIVAAEIAHNERPLTLRGLMYRVVSAGWLPSTDAKHYHRLGRLMTMLRERGVVPFSWIVDNIRETDKPSSWSGIGDYLDTVQDSYRKDLWASLPHYVHVFVEKDAVAGTVSPVTREFDVALSPIRGFVSLSYAHEIAELWDSIDKPIFAYYFGDFDPSGFDLERDVREKLMRYCQRPRCWYLDGDQPPRGWTTDCVSFRRLGVLPEDFAAFDLIPLAPKTSDPRYRVFVEQYGEDCAELDALPPSELRRRVRDAIESHVPADEWERLKTVEAVERDSFKTALQALRN